jgi:DNA-binding protein HU-beta
MNKKKLIRKISNDTGLTLKQAGSAVEALLDTVTDSLKRGKKFRLSGFGTFSIGRRRSRWGRHPRTGDKIKILASKFPKFTPARKLKDMVRK